MSPKILIYKPYRLRFTFRIDRIAHEEFKTMRAGGLAALETKFWFFGLSQSGTNQGGDSKMTYFLFCVFYKPYILRFTFRIDRIAHDEFKTMRAGGLAALEADIWLFFLIRSFATLYFFRSKPLVEHISSSWKKLSWCSDFLPPHHYTHSYPPQP